MFISKCRSNTKIVPVYIEKFDLFLLSIRSFFLNLDQLLEKDYEFITRPRYLVSRISRGTEYFSFEYREAEKFAAYEKKSRRRQEMNKKNVNIYVKKSWEFAVLKGHKNEVISIYFLT